MSSSPVDTVTFAELGERGFSEDEVNERVWMSAAHSPTSQDSDLSESKGDSSTAEQLQVENDRLIEELAQLRDRAILAEEEINRRDRETQQLREEV